MFQQQPSTLLVRRAVAAAAVSMAAAGCAGRELGGPEESFLDGRVPVADAYLDRTYSAHAGLLTAIGPDGLPITDGADADPLIAEARRFYDTVQYPYAQPVPVDYPDPFTGQPNPYRATAPLTLGEWKTAFQFPDRLPGESTDAFRARAGVVVYYNRNELGLGRELGCSQFVDALASDGSAMMGLACYVTNYGVLFDDQAGSLEEAVEGTHPRNTVCITYRPSLGAGYEVQFYTYASDGRRVEWAQLDTLGPRPHPLVCMNCHGGSYDGDRHLAKQARFLPLDPTWLAFADDGSPYSRPAQEERIRQLNVLSLSTPLTAAQTDYVMGMYGGSPGKSGGAAAPWAPPGWRGNSDSAALYQQVVRPYCATCHLAIETDAGGAPSALMRGLVSRADFAKAAIVPYVCSFQMPNAQPTMNGLWRAAPLTIGDVGYATGADALLAAFAGGGRPVCTELAAYADCRRGPDPDALCGDAHSGTACDPDTGQCISSARTLAAGSPSTGICRTDGSRGCPRSTECLAQATGVTGYDGVCVPCGRLGESACTLSAACETGLVADGNGLCTVAPS
jgi:hypothetical protein